MNWIKSGGSSLFGGDVYLSMWQSSLGGLLLNLGVKVKIDTLYACMTWSKSVAESRIECDW